MEEMYEEMSKQDLAEMLDVAESVIIFQTAVGAFVIVALFILIITNRFK